MADACLYLLEQPEDKLQDLFNKATPPLLNVGCGEDLSIKELAELIKDIVGFTGQLTFDVSKPDGTMRKVLDVGKLNQMGWQAYTPLHSGIANVYMDYLERNKEGV
jgi:GDP-L-fucose synthase